VEFQALDHVQLAMPPGGEPAARAFYGEVHGMRELRKPESGAGRGGCWFRSGPVELHLGVEADFRPARKAHPAIVVPDLAELTARLVGAGLAVTEGQALPGRRRAFSDDCFGNRIEWIERVP
jgi:catechol 2,3-dioxygenase-like lactoylglutathione lyase family enzyme